MEILQNNKIIDEVCDLVVSRKEAHDLFRRKIWLDLGRPQMDGIGDRIFNELDLEK